MKLVQDRAKCVDDFNRSKEHLATKEQIIKSIFHKKAPNYTEIEVSFFQQCALHCSFCWQDTYDPTGVEDIRSKADVAIDYLEKTGENLKDNIQVHLLGGELFEDSNDFYDDYTHFILKIKKYCDEKLPEKNLIFVFLTNMNFQKDSTKDKLENFLKNLEDEGCKFFLTTSWDLTGRPLKGEITTKFHQNITYFKKYLAEITFVLTKPSINRLLREDLEYLDLLYENFTLDYDYYMPTKNVDRLMPSDRDLLNALRLLIKRYPDIRKLRTWTESDEKEDFHKITCASLNKITILPDGSITNCKHLDYKHEDFESDFSFESNSIMIEKFLETQGCLSCPYFNECPLTCFNMADSKVFTARKELDECFYRTLFKERDEGYFKS